MQHTADIPFQHWSLKVGRADPKTREIPAFWGEIVTSIDDLHQAITDLILTPLGSVVTEPELGCDLLPYLDRPMDIAIPNCTRAIWDALTMWEPRIVIQDVQVREVSFSHLEAKVFWRPTESVLDDLLVTEVALNDQDSADRRVA